MQNLHVWNQVEQTDPDMTDRVNMGAYKFTTIDAMYQIRRATEVFGPCGLGWGLRNQKFEMLTVDPTDAHYNLLCFTAELWYTLDGKDGMCEIAADIELFENTKNGWKRVSDPMKKVRTDALTKGLSWLGFSADVFMGRFDDARYVQQLHQNKRQQQNKTKPAQAVMATAEQLETIQQLAEVANLKGADFSQWLRDSYNTSWSRINSQIADEVIAGLTSLTKEG